jgi:uncharacterized protein (TIGR02145 family)
MKYLLTITVLLTVVQETIKDHRDQKQYVLNSIGGKTWIKENLRYQGNNSGNLSQNNEMYGVYYKNNELSNVCPVGFHIPSLREWKSMIDKLPGKKNSRQGMLVPIESLKDYGLKLGGMGRQDTVLLSQVMGYYWTSTDTLKTNFKQPDSGLQKHLIGIHIWSSGEADSINVEPTYVLAKTYEPWMRMNCKCIKD